MPPYTSLSIVHTTVEPKVIIEFLQLTSFEALELYKETVPKVTNSYFNVL